MICSRFQTRREEDCWYVHLSCEEIGQAVELGGCFLEELAALDAHDESLAKWKASLGLGPGGSALAPNVTSGPKVRVVSQLFILVGQYEPPLYDR